MLKQKLYVGLDSLYSNIKCYFLCLSSCLQALLHHLEMLRSPSMAREKHVRAVSSTHLQRGSPFSHSLAVSVGVYVNLGPQLVEVKSTSRASWEMVPYWDKYMHCASA